jgi:hypothetical protein
MPFVPLLIRLRGHSSRAARALLARASTSDSREHGARDRQHVQSDLCKPSTMRPSGSNQEHGKQ